MRAVSAGADVLLQPVDATSAIDAVTAGVVLGRYSEARLSFVGAAHPARQARGGTAPPAAGGCGQRPHDRGRFRARVGGAADRPSARSPSCATPPTSCRWRSFRARRVCCRSRSRHGPDLAAGVTFDAELKRWFGGLRSEYADADDAAPNYARLLSLSDSADVIRIGPYIAQNYLATTLNVPPQFAQFVEELVKRGRHPFVVAWGIRISCSRSPCSRYIVGWAGFPQSQFAAARAVLGSARVSGRLPIPIPPYAALGAGLDLAPLALGPNGLPEVTGRARC